MTFSDAALPALNERTEAFSQAMDFTGLTWLDPDHLVFRHYPEKGTGGLTLPFSPRNFVRFLALMAVHARHRDWMEYVGTVLDHVYLSADSLSKVAWSVPWDDDGLDKVAMLLERGAKLPHVLNMATLLDTRSNHILNKRYADIHLSDPVHRNKSNEDYARFLARFDVANRLSAEEKALVFLNCKWHPEYLQNKPRMIADLGIDWNMVLRQSLVKLFFGFNTMQTDDVSWRRGHPMFARFIRFFESDIRGALGPDALTEAAIHLARWKPVPGLHLLPLLPLGARARDILASLPRKDKYYQQALIAFGPHLDDSDREMLRTRFTIRQFFYGTKDEMDAFRRGRFSNRILPQMGDAVIGHLSGDKIAPLHFRLKTTPRIANLVLDDIRWMVGRAREMGVSALQDDPCDGIARYLPELQTVNPEDLPRAYAPTADQYAGTSAAYFHDAYYHILDPGDAVLARKPQSAGPHRVPRGTEGILLRDGDAWAVDWTLEGGVTARTRPVDSQALFKRDLRRPSASTALAQAQAALPADHYIGMQGEVFEMPDWLEASARFHRKSGDFIQNYLDDIYSRFLFQPTYIFLKIPWVSKNATGPWAQMIRRRFEQVDWINLEQLDRLATSMQYVGLLKRRNLDDYPEFWELAQHLESVRVDFDPTVPPIRGDLAAIHPREARTFYHLDASQRVMKGIQDNPELFPDSSLATVFRDHLHSVIFEDEIFMDYARSIDYDGSGYFMTHVCFYLQATQDYDLLPFIFNYLEAIQVYQLEQGNVEVAGEILTCFFAILHRSPQNSPLFASSLKYLMETAGADYSWPDRFFAHLTPYKMLHVPWTAVQDIRPPEAMVAKPRNNALQTQLVLDIPGYREFLAKLGNSPRHQG